MSNLSTSISAVLIFLAFVVDGIKAAPILGLATPSPGATEKPKPTTVQSAQAEAVRLYPDIARSGSDVNALFVKAVDSAKRSNDPVMSQPDWPLVIAKRTLSIPANVKPNLSEIGFVEVDGDVFQMAIQQNGKIFLVGRFKNVAGVARDGFALLNSDGTVDETFTPAANPGGQVPLLVPLSDGKVLIGGWIDKLKSGIARLNADGTVDTGFKADWKADGCFATQLPSGKFLFSAHFNSESGMDGNYIACLKADGTLDSTFKAAPSYAVFCSAIQADGKIVIGGQFDVKDGPHNIARLNTDGTIDKSFKGNANGVVLRIATHKDGMIAVQGSFTTVNGVARQGFVRLHPDGTLDDNFRFTAELRRGIPPQVSPVSSFAQQTNGMLLIDGPFMSVGGMLRNGFARLKPDGTLDLKFLPTLSSPQFVSIQADEKIIVAGRIQDGALPPRKGIFRLNADGSLDSTFGQKFNK